MCFWEFLVLFRPLNAAAWNGFVLCFWCFSPLTLLRGKDSLLGLMMIWIRKDLSGFRWGGFVRRWSLYVVTHTEALLTCLADRFFFISSLLHDGRFIGCNGNAMMIHKWFWQWLSNWTPWAVKPKNDFSFHWALWICDPCKGIVCLLKTFFNVICSLFLWRSIFRSIVFLSKQMQWHRT